MWSGEARDRRVELVPAGVDLVRPQVTVDAEGEGWVGVAELDLYPLRRPAGRDHETRGVVPQIMDA
jgi:hypothetical protein